MKQYIVARTACRRPSLMHRIAGEARGGYKTLCGRHTGGWSMAWLDKPIKEIMCVNCQRRSR